MIIPHWAVAGAKVVCIYSGPWLRLDINNFIEDGPVFMQIYTIAKEVFWINKSPAMHLKELNPDYEIHLYNRNGKTLSFQPLISLDEVQTVEIERTLFIERKPKIPQHVSK
jgi:hypothetical protein